MGNLADKTFSNKFVDHFPGDLSGDQTPRQTPGEFYALTTPTMVKAPKLLGWSDDLGSLMGLDRPEENSDALDVLAGSKILSSMKPYASCYGGHQFGNWTGQLGDGRAITLGELEWIPGQSLEIQLKGAGLTAYSRRGDGRAVLRSSIREFLMSEAMSYLKIPTTRALSLVDTGEKVLRDMLYDGNAEHEPGAIVARVAPTFIRFGNFEILANRNEVENLQKLLDWVIENYYPDYDSKTPEGIVSWFQEVSKRTARMIAHWMRVGFVHGVMNTDNMSILGLTIDYGPFSMMDNFNPDFTPNTTDFRSRRYTYEKQPGIGLWNLHRLAQALLPLVKNGKLLETGLEAYEKEFHLQMNQIMAGKLGLDSIRNHQDIALLDEFGELKESCEIDMTLFYRQLQEVAIFEGELTKESLEPLFRQSFYRSLSSEEWEKFGNAMNLYRRRFQNNEISQAESLEQMKSHNPCFILRNYQLQLAIEAMTAGDSTPFERLLIVMKKPYEQLEGFEDLYEKRPDWAKDKPGCSVLSCSS